MTFKKVATEIKTAWDGSWITDLNKNVAPRLTGILFEVYQEYPDIPGSATNIKIIIKADPDYFKNELKAGGLDKRMFFENLQSWIFEEFKYYVLQPKSKEII